MLHVNGFCCSKSFPTVVILYGVVTIEVKMATVVGWQAHRQTRNTGLWTACSHVSNTIPIWLAGTSTDEKHLYVDGM